MCDKIRFQIINTKIGDIIDVDIDKNLFIDHLSDFVIFPLTRAFINIERRIINGEEMDVVQKIRDVLAAFNCFTNDPTNTIITTNNNKDIVRFDQSGTLYISKAKEKNEESLFKLIKSIFVKPKKCDKPMVTKLVNK